ncbi:MAG TPA: DUF2752 domain-containing protein [Acidimicrobiia bacterium]|nr:DUF2752 domain-containing protein [Acidimicrobiia bacterium]
MTSRRIPRPAPWIAPAVVATAASGAAGLLVAVDPNVPGHYPTCPFLAVTGLYCPGCGSLRLVHELLTGHPGAALGLNPLLMMVLPFLLYAYLRWAAERVAGVRLPPIKAPPWSMRLVPVLFIAFAVARNIPVAPFSVLAP